MLEKYKLILTAPILIHILFKYCIEISNDSYLILLQAEEEKLRIKNDRLAAVNERRGLEMLQQDALKRQEKFEKMVQFFDDLLYDMVMSVRFYVLESIVILSWCFSEKTYHQTKVVVV